MEIFFHILKLFQKKLFVLIDSPISIRLLVVSNGKVRLFELQNLIDFLPKLSLCLFGSRLELQVKP